jgi:hypothetical protein
MVCLQCRYRSCRSAAWRAALPECGFFAVSQSVSSPRKFLPWRFGQAGGDAADAKPG